MIGLKIDSTNQLFKKGMKSVVLLFLIFLAHEALSGIPVKCAIRIQPLLSIEENLEPCISKKSSQLICQFTCTDGIQQFFNLKNIENQFKAQYQKYCPSGDYCDCGAFAASIGQTNWFNSNVAAKFCSG
jgi:hypothetical protein